MDPGDARTGGPFEIGRPLTAIRDDGPRPDHTVGLAGRRALITGPWAFVPVTADARPLKAEVRGFDAVDAAQVVQIFGTRALIAALVRRQQRLTELGTGF